MGELNITGPQILFHIGGYPITETLRNQWIIMGILIFAAWFSTRNLQKFPKGKQHFAELWVSIIQGLVKQAMGEKNAWFAPYVIALLPFIFLNNISGLIGLRPATADLNTTLGLALMTVFMLHYYNIKSNGIITYLKGYLSPFPFFLPINIVGELSKPVSLSFRLFGKMFGGSVILSLIYLALPFFLKLVVPLPFHVYFDIFAGAIQSFIFTMLTMVFVAIAIG